MAAGPILRGLARGSWTVDALTWQEPVSEYTLALGVMRDVVRAAVAAESGADACASAAIAPAPLRSLASFRFPRRAGNTRSSPAASAPRASGCTSTAERRASSRGLRAIRASRCAAATASPKTFDSRDRSDCGRVRTISQYWVPRAWRATGSPVCWAFIPGRWHTRETRRSAGPTSGSSHWRVSRPPRGRRVRFFLGPHEEREAGRAEQDFRGAEGISIVREPLAEAARRLAECEVFVGNDAGFSHLASGLGVKTLALFGMTSEVRGAPVGPTDRVASVALSGLSRRGIARDSNACGESSIAASCATSSADAVYRRGRPAL